MCNLACVRGGGVGVVDYDVADDDDAFDYEDVAALSLTAPVQYTSGC